MKLTNNYATYNIPQCISESANLLIDTGADLNLIKLSSLKDDLLVSSKKIYNMQGINDQLVSTMGSTMLTVLINGRKYDTEFQVVSASFPVTGDGILGNPFLKDNQMIVDVGKGELTTATDVVSTIPPRSEMIISVKVDGENLTEQQTVLVHAQEINQNILCANVLNTVKDQKILFNVMNATEEPQTLTISKLSELSHEIFDVVTINNIETTGIPKNQCNRIQLIKDAIKCDHMNTEEKESIEQLCSEFSDIFFLEGDKIRCTEATMHEIKTPGVSQPIYQRPYRLPYAQKAEIEKQMEQLIQDEIISPSESPWNAPLLIVPKKIDSLGSKKYRVVVDFRKLNNLTVGDAFPMPDVTSILDQLGKAKYFTCLDMASGYHQISIHPNDKEKTAFSTDKGHYEFNRMCFGLKGAPATFQRLMNRVLQGINGYRTFVYLDDIIVVSSTLQEHIKQLREVFTRLRRFNLQLQPPKCEFMRHEVNYLGHVITKEGVKPDIKKVECVVNYPTPSNAKEVKSFLGLVGYYRKFIQNFSKIAKPLTELLKQGQPFIWTDLCQNAFNYFREILTKEPLLQHPDFNKPFVITTDASNIAIGAVLSQGKIGSDLPISYASRTLNKAKKNYNTTEKELLAIIWATKQFRPYLYGRKFTIVTDHRPLTWLFGVKDPGSRLVRWRLQLEEFDYEVVYKPGTQNTNSDALSRISITTVTQEPEISGEYQKYIEEKSRQLILGKNIKEIAGDLFEAPGEYALSHCVSQDFQMDRGIALEFRRRFGQIDELCNQKKSVTEIASIVSQERTIICLITKEHYWQKPTYENLFLTLTNLKHFCIKENITKLAMPKIACGLDELQWPEVRTMIRYVFRKTQVQILIFIDNEYSKEEKLKIIEEFHNAPMGGHQGISRTIKRIKQHHNWIGLKKDVQAYVSSCSSCQKNKSSNTTIQQPMLITTTASRPFERIALDIVGPLTTSEKQNSYILTVQDDLTKFSAAFPLRTHDANSVAKALVEGFVCQHGIPEAILTDCGTEFLSKLFKECCKLLQIEKINTTPYHPQTNGSLERSHRTLTEYLRHYVDSHHRDWDDYVAYAMFVYNTTKHTTTNYQPYELVYGFPASVPHTLSRAPSTRYNYDDYAAELKQKLQESHKIAQETIISAKEKSKERYDNNNCQLEVHVGDKVWIKNHNQKGKLGQKWLGPFPVISLHENENVSIQRGRKEVRLHKNELKTF